MLVLETTGQLVMVVGKSFYQVIGTINVIIISLHFFYSTAEKSCSGDSTVNTKTIGDGSW